MTEYIAKILTEKMFTYGLIIQSDKETYHYHIQVLIEKSMGFSIIIMLSFFWQVILETMMFLFCFSAIRRHAGGYHAKSFWGCFMGTISIYCIYVKILFPIFRDNINLNMILFLLAAILVIIIGAVNHPNMEWSIKEYEDSKMITRIIVVVEVSCITVFYFLDMESNYSVFMSFGLILSAFLLALGKIVGQEVKAR